jgi:hypothetical protein
MKTIIKLIVVIILCQQSRSMSGQDTLLLMNGREMPCKIVNDTGTVFVFEIKNKRGKIKTHEIHKNDVFSFTKAGYDEYILYTQNEFFGDIYGVDEMRYYLAGQNDARNNFRAWPTFLVGFVTCGTIAFLGQDGYITAMVPPLLYMGVQLIPKIKIREETMSHPEYKYNEIYADGYEPPARSRKLFRAMEGGYAGAATGILAWLILVKK